MKTLLFTITTAVALLSMAEAPRTTLYVNSKSGNDANRGDRAQPVASLQRAQKLVREYVAGGTGVTVAVEGEFNCARNGRLILTGEDSGKPTARVEWVAGASGAKFTGAIKLSKDDFKLVADETILARLRPAARGKVYECDLAKKGVTQLRPLPRQFSYWNYAELFANGKNETIARYPNQGWLEITNVVDRGVNPVDRKTGEWEHGARGGVFKYEDSACARWNVKEGVYLQGFWCHDWSCETLRLAKIDNATREITTEGIHSYGVGNSSKWNKSLRRYYAYNLLEELDVPGEWYLNRATRKLYYYPRDNKFADVYLSLQTSPLIEAKGIENISFKGFEFKYSIAEAMRISGGKNITIDGLKVSYIGRDALTFHGMYDSIIKNCRVWQIGSLGLLVSGGDRRWLKSANTRVTQNEIHHCARLSRIHGPCYTFNGCGITTDHNYFHDTPYIAVTYGGNNHTFEYNEIECAMMESGDGGGVYTGRDWGSQGTIVRYNYFHHFGAPGVELRKSQGVAPEYEPLKGNVMVMGLYLDDCDSGETIYGNIFYKTGWAMFCGGGRDNKWRDNLCIDCTSAAQLDVRGLKRARPGEGTKDGWDLSAKIEQFHYTEAPWCDAYPHLVNVMSNDPKLPIGTEFTGNVAINCSEFFRIWESKDHPAVTVLKTRLECRDNLHFTDAPGNTDTKYFDQTDPANRKRIAIEKLGALSSLTGNPFVLLTTSEFKKLCPTFPAIPTNKIGLGK